MQVYKYTFTKTALKLTKSYINFMRRPCIFLFPIAKLCLILANEVRLKNETNNYNIDTGRADVVLQQRQRRL